jgi:hypothetical protein
MGAIAADAVPVGQEHVRLCRAGGAFGGCAVGEGAVAAVPVDRKGVQCSRAYREVGRVALDACAVADVVPCGPVCVGPAYV